MLTSNRVGENRSIHHLCFDGFIVQFHYVSVGGHNIPAKLHILQRSKARMQDGVGMMSTNLRVPIHVLHFQPNFDIGLLLAFNPFRHRGVFNFHGGFSLLHRMLEILGGHL